MSCGNTVEPQYYKIINYRIPTKSLYKGQVLGQEFLTKKNS